ncbi:MAG: hypothetical protein WCK63_08905 [Betaproteobacteria bacterium]
MNDCKSLGDRVQGVLDLPTRQKNALRLLLSKPSITPQEIAGLNCHVLERAPGVGKQSLAIIRAWLNSHGYELSGQPNVSSNKRQVQHQKKLERAIEYLRRHGYEVRRSQR